MFHRSKIPIKDNGEKLEVLSPQEFIIKPAYFEMGISDTKVMKLRSGTIDRLRIAKKNLRKIKGCEKWNFKIWDGFRPVKVQKRLCDGLANSLKKEHPSWSAKQIQKEVSEFLAFPSLDPNFPAPHNTGGTVDLTIVDGKGNEIPMGTGFDDFTRKSHSNYFAKSGSKEKSAPIFHKNRMLFKKIMENVGFVNAPTEWWHFCCGTQEWARKTHKKYAIYGSAEF